MEKELEEIKLDVKTTMEEILISPEKHLSTIEQQEQYMHNIKLLLSCNNSDKKNSFYNLYFDNQRINLFSKINQMGNVPF